MLEKLKIIHGGNLDKKDNDKIMIKIKKIMN